MKGYMMSVALVLGVLLSGCKTGATPRHYYKAMGPIAEMQLEMGTDISMLSGRSKYYWSHELLAFDDDGLLVRVDDKLVLVDYDAMVRYKHRNKRAVFTKNQTAGAIRSEIANMYNGGMAFLARYPQGVSDQLLNGLLEAYGQEEIIKISSKNS